MRLSRRGIQAAAAVAAVVSAGPARAAISYDLRWADGQGAYDGGHSVFPSLGAHALELWVRVSGTDGSNTNEAHSFDYITILSAGAGGQNVLGAGSGLVAGAPGSGFADSGSRSGSGSDLNGDGVNDWGSTSTNASNTNYMIVRSAIVGGRVGGGTTGQAVDANTWEFKIADFTVDVNSYGPGAVTQFVVAQHEARFTSGAFTYATSVVDGLNFSITSSNTQSAYSLSQGATMLVPEPGALALFGAATVGLLARRRKRAAS